MRTLSHRYGTKMNLVAVASPSRDKRVTLTPSDAFKRIYPVETEAVTCFALHVAGLRGADCNRHRGVSAVGADGSEIRPIRP